MFTDALKEAIPITRTEEELAQLAGPFVEAVEGSAADLERIEIQRVTVGRYAVTLTERGYSASEPVYVSVADAEPTLGGPLAYGDSTAPRGDG